MNQTRVSESATKSNVKQYKIMKSELDVINSSRYCVMAGRGSESDSGLGEFRGTLVRHPLVAQSYLNFMIYSYSCAVQNYSWWNSYAPSTELCFHSSEPVHVFWCCTVSVHGADSYAEEGCLLTSDQCRAEWPGRLHLSVSVYMDVNVTVLGTTWPALWLILNQHEDTSQYKTFSKRLNILFSFMSSIPIKAGITPQL